MMTTFAANRPFTRVAAELCFGVDSVKSLDRGDCPCCGNPVGAFRDSLSRKEFEISGMCQICQDQVFT